MDILSLFQRKPVQQLLKESGDSNKLHRSLDAKQITLMGVGTIIGAGIFVLTGQVAASNAGPAIILSFVLSGIACSFAAFCYAEMAAMIPISGSAYTFAYATLGEFFAWVIGWDLILEYLFGASAVAVGWSGYLVSFTKDFGFAIPNALAQAPLSHDGGGWIFTGAVFNFPAALICLICTLLLALGIRESAKFSNFVIILKLSVLALFVIAGVFYITPANWLPFIPENSGKFGEFGYSGIFRGAAVVFFAHIGFDTVSTLAQETKNPQKDMPRGIIGSLVIATLVYILVALVLTGIVHYSQLNVPDPLAVAVNASGEALRWLRPLVKLGAVVGLTSVVLMLILGQSRVFYTMANDGLLPRSFAHVHRKLKTPYIPTLVCGIFAATLAGLMPIDILAHMVSIGTLLAFVIVCIGVVALRYTDPSAQRPFKVPAVLFVGPAGALCAIGQMIFLPSETWFRLFIWMVIGLIIYFAFSRTHSRLAKRLARDNGKLEPLVKDELF